MFPNPHLFGVPVPWYSAIAALTAVVSAIFFYKQYARLNFSQMQGSKKILFSFFYTGTLTLIGFAGARILSVTEVFLEADHSHTAKDFIKLAASWGSGYSWYGGFLLIILLLPVLLKLFSKQHFLSLLDITALTCCFAYAIGRFACLLSGDGCYGKWTNLPWGMHFRYGHSPSLLPVHPTPLYESVIHFMLLLPLMKLDKRKRFPGQTLCIFLFFTALSRFFIEFIRINEKIALNLTMAQWLSVFLILLSALLYALLSRQKSLIPKNLPV